MAEIRRNLQQGWRVADDGIVLSSNMSEEHLQVIKNMKLHPQDVMVAGYPKCGNTWMMTTVSAIMADDLNTFRMEGPSYSRGPMELLHCWESIKDSKHPTVLMSHLPYEYLPEDVKMKKIKIIHMTRNPKDVMVSFYHFAQMNKHINLTATFDEYVHNYLHGDCVYGDWFNHMKRWLVHKDDPLILFIQYEQFIADPCGVVGKVAEFLGRNLPAEKIEAIAGLVSFKSMQTHPKLTLDPPSFDDCKGQFMRKGKVGDWKNHLTEEQSKACDEKCQEFVKETGYTITFE